MKRHIATALLAGMGVGIEAPRLARALEWTEVRMPMRLEQGAACRASEFGHLKSAGRFRTSEIASIFVDDGLLFADWSGQVNATQPRRIETEELDAEWMAHRTGSKWLLARRELVPSDGQIWSIQLYADAAHPAKVQLIATAADGENAFTTNYLQSAGWARLSVRGNRDGMRVRPWSASGISLAEIRQRHPVIVDTYLEPALKKMVC